MLHYHEIPTMIGQEREFLRECTFRFPKNNPRVAYLVTKAGSCFSSDRTYQFYCAHGFSVKLCVDRNGGRMLTGPGGSILVKGKNDDVIGLRYDYSHVFEEAFTDWKTVAENEL